MAKALDAKVEYQTAMSLFSSEGGIQWGRYSAMLVVNTILFTLARLDVKLSSSGILQLSLKLIPLFGIILCFLWERMTRRGFEWMIFWISQARNMEEDPVNKNLPNPIMKGYQRKLEDRELINTQRASILVIYIFVLLYFIILVDNFFIILSRF